MKAIFSSFGRRANVDSRQDHSEVSYKTKLASVSSSSDALHPRATHSSFGTPAGGIGDAPSSDRIPSSRPASHTAWTSRFTSSSRDSLSYQRNPVEPSYANVDPTGATTTTSGPSHPPSSYRQASKKSTGANGAARGLVRKFSSGRESLQTNPRGTGQEHRLSTSSKAFPGSNYVGASPSNQAHGSSQPSSLVSPASRRVADLTRDGVANTDLSVMTSTELGARLNELAVANADGLLTDDEYRLLRQAVFDQLLLADKPALAVPTDNARTGLGLPSQRPTPDIAKAKHAPDDNVYLSASPLDVGAGRSKSSLGHGDQQASSIRSGRSGESSSFHTMTHLFRGSSNTRATARQPSQDSHSSHDRAAPIRRDSGGVSSQSGDGHSQRAWSFRTQQSSAAKSSRMSTLGRLKLGSQPRVDQMENASRERREALSAERTARSLRAVSIYDASGAAFSKLSGADHNSSASSLRAETAPTSMFGAEYVDKSTSEIQAEIDVVQAEGNRMLATFVALEESLLTRQTSLEPLAVKSVVERLQELNPMACIADLAVSDQEKHQSVLHPRSSPPSSYRTPRALQVLSVLLSPESVDTGDSTDIATFRTELNSIYVQKSAVVKRYQDRLAFLASKLRSAAIREGLK